MKRVFGRYHIYILLVAFTVLALAACENPNVATPTSGIVTPLSTLTPASTPTPLNEFFLGEILKTPQPSPWATSLPDDTGITPGITTEAEVQTQFGNPDSLGCIIDNKVHWTVDCQAPGGFRKFFAYPNRRLSLQLEQGRVISIEKNVGHEYTTAKAILAAQGIPEVVEFMIPPKYTQPPPPNPWGELVYASKGVKFTFDCLKGSGQLCDGVSRDAPIDWITYFAPMNITDWFKQERTKTPFDSDSGLEFYIRPWEGYNN